MPCACEQPCTCEQSRCSEELIGKIAVRVRSGQKEVFYAMQSHAIATLMEDMNMPFAALQKLIISAGSAIIKKYEVTEDSPLIITVTKVTLASGAKALEYAVRVVEGGTEDAIAAAMAA